MSPDELIVREMIRDVEARYCRGIDRRDREIVSDCFHPDATDDHGTGPRSIDDFVDWCFALLDEYDSTFHFIGQTLVTVAPDRRTARAETYGIAHHRSAGGEDRHNLVTGFRYLDSFTPAGDRWRIRERRAVTDWSRIDRADEWWAVPDRLLRGVAGPEDPSYD